MNKAGWGLGIVLCVILGVGCQQANSPSSTTYTLTPGTLTNGTMTPVSVTTVSAGVATAIIATPNSGFVFSGWSATPTGSASFASATSASTTVTLTGNATITATFTGSNLPQSPTLALLTGTWGQSSTITLSNGSTMANSYTLVISGDGTFSEMVSSITTPNGGSPGAPAYSAVQGTLSISGNSITLTDTQGYNGASATPTWTPISQILTYPAVFLNGNFYFAQTGSSILSAQGTVVGLTGTWSEYEYYSFATSPYIWSQITFAADGTYISNQYASKTATMPSTATNTSSGTYTNANGILTMTQTSPSSATPGSGIFSIASSVLILGSSSTSSGAWVKE